MLFSLSATGDLAAGEYKRAVNTKQDSYEVREAIEGEGNGKPGKSKHMDRD